MWDTIVTVAWIAGGAFVVLWAMTLLGAVVGARKALDRKAEAAEMVSADLHKLQTLLASWADQGSRDFGGPLQPIIADVRELGADVHQMVRQRSTQCDAERAFAFAQLAEDVGPKVAAALVYTNQSEAERANLVAEYNEANA